MADYTLACAAGAYTITGTAATLRRAAKVVPEAGAYAVTGTAVELFKGPTLRLGPLGSRVNLPTPIWPSGSAPEFPYEQDSGAEESQMLDGSIKVNFKSYSPGSWPITWDGITWAQVQTILGAAALGQQLVYTNQYVDSVDHNVYVQSRSYSLKGDTAQTTPRYVFNLTLKEIL